MATVQAAAKHEKAEPSPARRRSTRPKTAGKNKAKPNRLLDESTVRAIRCAYRPGVSLRQLEERFSLSGGVIISVANRCSYAEHPTGDGEYEPPRGIRGTRRREQAVAKYTKQEPAPVERTDTNHLMPEAMAVIREAIDDGEPIRRIARSFGLTPKTLAHMKPAEEGITWWH